MIPNGESTWKIDVLLAGSWRGASAVLLTNGGHHALVDTGLPHEAHLLVEALEQRGLGAGDIRTVINTHFHIDHVLNNCLFSQALVYASQQSYEWCRQLYADLGDEENWEKLVLKYYPETHDYERSQRYMEKLRNLALRWWDVERLGPRSSFRWLEKQPLPEGLEALVTCGHVPGHASLIVHTPEQPALIAGDALLSHEHEERVLTMIPHNREQYRRDRSLILEKARRIIPGHDRPFVVAPSGKPTSPEE